MSGDFHLIRGKTNSKTLSNNKCGEMEISQHGNGSKITFV